MLQVTATFNVPARPRAAAALKAYAIMHFEGPALRRLTGRRGRGRWDLEYARQVEMNYESERPVLVERSIDRVADRYTERIVFLDSREVVRKVDEPLSAHQGRGAAGR